MFRPGKSLVTTTAGGFSPSADESSPMPADPALDSTWALLREGYPFIAERCRRFRSPVFRARILFRNTICLSGAAAARIFYDPGLFVRGGAPPRRLKKMLFGEGAVQTLDDEAHHRRKAMILAVMNEANVARLVEGAGKEWRAAAARWLPGRPVVLLEESREVLLRAVCIWAGIPFAEHEVRGRSADIAALLDGLGSAGPRHWRGRLARMRCERWMRDTVCRARRGELVAPADSALAVVAGHREPDGSPLPERVAAAELFNLVRPVVAVDRFIVFAALALHQNPECRLALAAGGPDDPYTTWFVQEVRRFFPFFPFVAARVRRDFVWHGHRFPAGRRTLLDIYGTDHDADVWGDPDVFRPERFRAWNGSAFNFIPQGGGDVANGHRCPGEALAIALMKDALRFLAGGPGYDVPPQDLSIDLARMPAKPASGFVLRPRR